MFCLSNKDEFQCKSDECIKWSYVCDGISHCSNRADEDCDMCTNDLYLCKDSSRINCTLACSTLGYIPCKNYVDKKICASVNKKSCLFVVISFVILFLLFGVLYNRYKRRKHRSALSSNDTNETNTNSNQNTHTNNQDSLNDNIKLTNSVSHNSLVYFDEQNKIYQTPNTNRIKLKSNNNPSQFSNENIFKQTKNLDYQMYGEPPPTYKQSKYYPKASVKSAEPLLKIQPADTDEQNAHIYENIDESSSQSESINSTNQTKTQIKVNKGTKRAPFQAVKQKHSGQNSSTRKNTKLSCSSSSSSSSTSSSSQAMTVKVQNVNSEHFL